MDISWWISDAAARTPTKTAVRFENRDLTYRMLEERVAALAGQLREAGVVDGDRIAYLGPSCPELLESLFACARLGAIFVPAQRQNAGRRASDIRRTIPAARPDRRAELR